MRWESIRCCGSMRWRRRPTCSISSLSRRWRKPRWPQPLTLLDGGCSEPGMGGEADAIAAGAFGLVEGPEAAGEEIGIGVARFALGDAQRQAGGGFAQPFAGFPAQDFGGVAGGKQIAAGRENC